MDMKKSLLIGIPSVLVVGLIGAYYVTRPNDEALIQQTLKEAVVASKEGKANPVMDAISGSFKYGEEMPDRRELARLIKEAKPEFSILTPTAKIEGDTAKVHSDVAVSFSFMTMTMDQTVKDVDITLAREPALDFGIVPSSKWRIVSVTGPALPQGE